MKTLIKVDHLHLGYDNQEVIYNKVILLQY